MIDDTRIAFQTRRLAQALRATDDLTAATKNKAGQHLILVTVDGQEREIMVAEGNALGACDIDFVGNGVIYAHVSGRRKTSDAHIARRPCEGVKTFPQASTGDFDLKGILAHLRGE